MGNRIYIKTRYHKQGWPEVRVDDNYDDSGWVPVDARLAEEDRLEWLDQALGSNSSVRDILEAALENQSFAQFDGEDFDVEQFWKGIPVRQARQKARALDDTLPASDDSSQTLPRPRP